MIENIDNNIVRVRFPNESYYDTIHNFKWNEFKGEKYFPECVFGWYEDDFKLARLILVNLYNRELV